MMGVTLTESAARHVSRYIEKRGKGIGLRLGVRTTGCSGMAYKLEYADQTQPEDLQFESHGVKVFVDPRSLALLEGTVLDFDDHNMMATNFILRNPNAKSACGCGTSFSV